VNLFSGDGATGCWHTENGGQTQSDNEREQTSIHDTLGLEQRVDKRLCSRIATQDYQHGKHDEGNYHRD
jgi:hypothetical protein